MEKKLTELKNKLRKGDNKIIAEKAKCSQEHVSRVFNGQMRVDTPKGKLIVSVALQIIEARKKLKPTPLTDSEYHEWIISK